MKSTDSLERAALEARIRKYSVIAAAAAAVPFMQSANATVIGADGVTSNTPVDIGDPDDQIFFSVIGVDVDAMLAAPGDPSGSGLDLPLDNVDALLTTWTVPKNGGMMMGEQSPYISFAKVLTPEAVLAVAASQDIDSEADPDMPTAFAMRYADALAAAGFDPDVDFSSAAAAEKKAEQGKTEKGQEFKALLFAEVGDFVGDETPTFEVEQLGLFPPTEDPDDRGFIAFAREGDEGSVPLEIRVNAGDGITDRTITVFGVDEATGVPSPSTWSLMALGFAGIVALRRRQKTKATQPDA